MNLGYSNEMVKIPLRSVGRRKMTNPYFGYAPMNLAKTALGVSALAAAIWAQAGRTVWDGVYTEEQSKRGQAIYAKECASCHGTQMTGGESAPPLAGDAFMSNWTGQTAGELLERIRQSMPMDDPGRLSRQQDADVIAYIFNANGFPAGKTELDKQTEVLRLIKIAPK